MPILLPEYLVDHAKVSNFEWLELAHCVCRGLQTGCREAAIGKRSFLLAESGSMRNGALGTNLYADNI